MIRLRLGIEDIERTRFVYSPMVEVAESLYVLASGSVPQVHRGWYDAVRPELGEVDLALLSAVVPARPLMAGFFFDAPTGSGTTFGRQLAWLRELSPDVVRRELEQVWEGSQPPTVAELVTEPRGVDRLADSLEAYWALAIAPYWRAMRSVLEEDIAFRAARLATGGLAAMFAELHEKVSVDGDVLRVDLMRGERSMNATDGLRLMPSIFVWPNIAFGIEPGAPSRLTYAARGVGNVWATIRDAEDEEDDDSLGALLGRSRAAILSCLATPHSTTELADKLGQSKPAVSQHLTVLRRCGLVTSWRSGRSVLYRRTPLATSVVEARHADADRSAPA